MNTEFSDQQYDSAYPDGMEYHWWNLARSKILVREISAFVGPAAKILEVGCGRGIVVKSLRDAGIDCSGVELASVRPVDSVDRHIRTGTDAVELPQTDRDQYDTILLLDVIEHISVPVEFVKQLADRFPHVSRIVVTVPARNEIWSNYDEHYGHFRRYTPEMLSSLSGELGWDLVRTSYFFHAVYPPAWLLAKLKRKRQTRLKPPQGAAKLIHHVVAQAMTLDYYLLPGRLAGTSVIGCLQR